MHPDEYLASVRKLLEEHQNEEPFAELPENISLQLAAFQKKSNDEAIQLATSLSQLYSSNQTKLDKQKKITYYSFGVGLLGVVIAVVSFLTS